MIRAPFLLVLAFLLLAGAAPSHAQSRGAAFVADMDSGEVLHARQADEPRHPASLTKMMTLYMLFEALEDGRVSMDTTLTASAEAASRPASDLGLETGDTLSVETAIRALVIRSANDVAVVVGEHLSGTESAFAADMTRRAAELGLQATLFRNASGLPDNEQITTARDMARLAHALSRDFPQYWHYFSEERFTYGSRTWRNHNSLVGRVDGVDGLKTGYIRASGFNVVTTSQRNGHRLVTVVMGGRTAAVRDSHAEDLLEAAYTAIDARAEGRLLAALQTPRLNPVREQAILTAELADLREPTAMGSAEGAPPVSVVLADPADMRPARSRPAPLSEPTPAAQMAAAPAPQADTAASWAVQVGAYTSQAAALARLESLRDAHLASEPALTPFAEAVDRNGRTLWRARFNGVDASGARRVCQTLANRGEPCFAVSPNA
ncbi:serine hydrolase [Marinicauda pacifica]|jgi:D-alanyl-D-alanine carboxypeptidase|uniref:serine hydrolase n=1 Tax=Marinicauda pacifica TaxID=1133559 RepID=UPI0035C7EC93